MLLSMDNLVAHQYYGGEVLEGFFRKMGVEFLFTPMYLPDLNPVELCFNEVKTLLN